MVELSASSSAFSALRADGAVVSWGALGGRCEATGVVKVVGALEQIVERVDRFTKFPWEPNLG